MKYKFRIQSSFYKTGMLYHFPATNQALLIIFGLIGLIFYCKLQ